MRTYLTNPQLRPISLIAKSLWSNWSLKKRFDRELYTGAAEAGIIHDKSQPTQRRDLCYGRVHADFERMVGGRPAKFSENTVALQNIADVLLKIGFKQDDKDLTISSKALRLIGRMDAAGYLDGYMPSIVEIKVVNYIPQFVRAADAAQLLMYSLAQGTADKTILVVIYVQPTGSFKAEARFVANQSRLIPLVNELMNN